MATILKPNNADSPSRHGFSGIAGFNLDDLAAAGVLKLQQIEAEAARIIQAAQTEATVIKQQAQDAGRAEGLKQAATEAEQHIRAGVEAEIAARMPVLESAVQQIIDAEQAYLDAFRDALIGTVVQASERVVQARLESEPQVLERWARSAIQAVKSARRIVVAVHPETLVAHAEALERMLAAPGLPDDSRIEPDESLEPEGLVVRVDGGTVEATLRSAMERLEEMLRGN